MNQLLAEQIEMLQNLLVAEATGSGGGGNPNEYRALREEVISHPLLMDIAPRFLKTCTTTGQFWQFIKWKFPSYAERRQYIWDELRPIFDRVEGRKTTPSDLNVSVALEQFSTESVHRVWLKAMERRDTDPEGAITLARTLLESVCKHILEENQVTYDPDSDLPGLYKILAKTMNIAPSQHTAAIFKQILGGCTAVVEGLGALRNRLSDAHGTGKRSVKPAPRHAELAVNLAGAVSLFLVATHQARGKSGSEMETQ